MLPYLSKQFRLILVDIRGHGRSSKPECCYGRLDFAYDIKLLLDALEAQQADLVGHSLGSIITSPTPVDPDFIRRQREDAARMRVRPASEDPSACANGIMH